MKIITYLRASLQKKVISSLLKHIQHLFETKSSHHKNKVRKYKIFLKIYTKTTKSMQNMFQASFFLISEDVSYL
jgi:hypothetical protein